MKKLLYLTIMLLAIVATSCDDDKETATVPVLGTLTLSPDTCVIGNQIKASIAIANEGELSSLTKFTINYSDATISSSAVSTFSRDSLNNITFSFTAPEHEGRLTISVFGTASLYAGSQLYATTNTIESSIFLKKK